MNTQTLTSPVMLSSFVVASVTTATLPAEPLHACSRDFGFDIDQEVLAKELLALLPTNTSSPAVRGIDEDQAAAAHLHFLS